MEIINDPGKGQSLHFKVTANRLNMQPSEILLTFLGTEPLDKLRIFLQWYLTTEQEVSRSDLDGFVKALDAAGASTVSIAYVKTVRQLTRESNLVRSICETSSDSIP